MKATMLLCDHAQVANDKLYVLGGGWSHVAFPDMPFPLALAVLLHVPWTAANEKHKFSMRLIDDDGELQSFLGVDVTNEAEFEVGRPPGLKPGSDINQPMVFKYDGLALPAGGYVFEFAVNKEVIARTPFRVGTN